MAVLSMLARLAGRGLIFRHVDIDLLRRILQPDPMEAPRMAGARAPDDGTIPAEQILSLRRQSRRR
jgi:hypothetical protein